MVPLAQGYLGYLVLSCGTTPTTMQFYLYYPITSNCSDSFISYFSKVQSFTNKSLSLLTRIFIFRSKHFFQSLFCFIICCCPCIIGWCGRTPSIDRQCMLDADHSNWNEVYGRRAFQPTRCSFCVNHCVCLPINSAFNPLLYTLSTPQVWQNFIFTIKRNKMWYLST